MKLIQLHMYQVTPLFPIFRALSRNLHRHSLLPKATFTQSIQPNLGLPRTRPSLTSAINTLLAIRYSSILSICSDLRYSLTPFLLKLSYAPLHSLLSPFATPQANFSNTSSQEHSLSFSQHYLYPMPRLRTTPLVQLVLLHIDTS